MTYNVFGGTLNPTLLIPVSTGTKSIKIDQETPELLTKTKWHGFLWLTVYNDGTTGQSVLLDGRNV